MTQSALSGVNVLDLTHYIAGPYCTRLLAGFGADVIKVERRIDGDPARGIGPFVDDQPGLELSIPFLYLNGNKKSVTLDLKSEVGRELLEDLVKRADVIVESFRPGVMARLGFDYKSVRKINPRAVMTSISNFGQTGPYRDFKLSHIGAWGMSGARYTNGRANERPVQAGGWLTHYITGLYATIGTATALYHRIESGTGQHLDVSMMESSIMAACHPASIFSFTGLVHTDHSGTAGPEVYTTRDGGYVGVSSWTLPQWQRLFDLLGVPELDDDRFRASFEPGNEKERRSNRITLRARLAEQVGQRDRMELFQTAMEWMVPIVLAATTQEILDSPQLRARGFFEDIDHPVVGAATMPGAPFKMSASPWRSTTPAPLLGQHNEEVYHGRLGYPQSHLAEWARLGVV